MSVFYSMFKKTEINKVDFTKKGYVTETAEVNFRHDWY